MTAQPSGQMQILPHGQSRNKAQRLEDQADLVPPKGIARRLAAPCHGLAINHDLALVRCQQSGNGVNQCRLARS